LRQEPQNYINCVKQESIMQKYRFIVLLVALSVLLLAACAPSGGKPTATAAPAPTGAPTQAMPEPTTAPAIASPAQTLADTLGNLSYAGLVPDQVLALKDGAGTYADGTVRLLDQLIAQGDVNGDGKTDAVVLLDDEPSGSGHFIWVAAVLDAMGKPAPTEAIMLGDRIGVKSLTIDNGQIVADIVGQGTGDVACCGTWNIQKVLALKDGQLAEQSSKEMSKVSLSDLNGTWRLVDLNSHTEPALADVEATMQIADGQISGSAGCNNYNATLSGLPDDPSAFKVGPVASTKKACPDPIMKQETEYLTRLGQVKAWKYDAGQLALLYDSSTGTPQYLVFEPMTAK
jgi:heat shock protein HslJ